jgi:predicted ATPase/class 3 adenylate cyclase
MQSMVELPGGTVTFLLTDIEKSTILWERAPAAMRAAMVRHDALFEQAVAANDGAHIRPRGEGDSRFAVFAGAAEAVAAAAVVLRAFAAEVWPTPFPVRVRIGLHTGEAELRDGDYYGSAVNRCARLRGIAHGGQVLLSESTTVLARDDLSVGLSLESAGEHRLKDLSRPERVWQLVVDGLPADFPPLLSLDSHPHNLPIHPTALLGRDETLAEVCGLLSRPDVRLVTLTGPGGTGKTRLSVQVAAELIERFADGAFFVSLAPLVDASLVPSAIAGALGVQDMGSRPILDGLKDYLRGKSMLLVLDNFEQILPAAGMVAELLAASTDLRVLVTSREPLRLRGEREVVVPSLALPERGRVHSAETLSQYASVALFIERAVAIRAEFAVTNENAPAVAEIFARLDGLPLAIELAAARIRLFTPQAMLGRLERRLPFLTGGARDLPARHQTLRSTVAWSYDLLEPGEQRLFRRLGVFVGGFTLESAEAVCAEGLEVDVLDGVSSLVAKSLLRADDGDEGEPRFRMLATVQELSLELLESSGEAEATRRRHAEQFAEFAERAEPELHGPRQVEWYARLETEHDNLRAALTWCETADPDLGLRIASALGRFWNVHGYLREGLQRLESALGRSMAPSAARVTALGRAGRLAAMLGDPARARVLTEASLSIALGLADQRAIAWALQTLGFALSYERNYSVASAHYKESLAISRPNGDLILTTETLGYLGAAHYFTGDHDDAWVTFEEVLTLARQMDHVQGIGLALGFLGRVAAVRGKLGDARALQEQALVYKRQIGNDRSAAVSICAIANIDIAQAQFANAREHLRECLAIFQRVGDWSNVIIALNSMASLERAIGRPVVAARLGGAAERMSESPDATRVPTQRVREDPGKIALRDLLGPDEFDAASAAGRAMTMEQAVAYALEREPTA